MMKTDLDLEFSGCMLLKFLMSFSSSVELHGSKKELPRETKQIRWSPPLSGWVRLNINGASKNDFIA